MRAMNIVSGLCGLVGGQLMLNFTVPMLCDIADRGSDLAAVLAVGALVGGVIGVILGTQQLLDGLFPFGGDADEVPGRVKGQ